MIIVIMFMICFNLWADGRERVERVTRFEREDSKQDSRPFWSRKQVERVLKKLDIQSFLKSIV